MESRIIVEDNKNQLSSVPLKNIKKETIISPYWPVTLVTASMLNLHGKGARPLKKQQIIEVYGNSIAKNDR